jgi:hypothetical protein
VYEKHVQNLVGNLKGKDRAEYLGVDGRIILEWILRKKGGNVWNGFNWLRIGTSAGLLWKQ